MSPEKVTHLKNICLSLVEVQETIMHFDHLSQSDALIDRIETERQVFNFESEVNQTAVFEAVKKALIDQDKELKRQLIQKATEIIEPYKND